MSLLPSLVAVRKISSAVPRTTFDPGKIDEAARLILQIGALLDPLIVRRLDLESFELCDGHFAYYAAVRARELDPLRGETVLAFIAEEEAQQAVISRQVELLKGGVRQEPVPGKMPVEISPEPNPSSDLGNRLSNFERRIEQIVQGLEQTVRREAAALQGNLSEVATLLPQPIAVMEVLNGGDELTLFERLRAGNIKGKRAETMIRNILTARKEGDFRSLKDVVERVGGLGADGLLSLLEVWDGISINRPPKRSGRKKTLVV